MYQIIIGEKGNEIGHIMGTDENAEIAADKMRRAAEVYDGDGWGIVRDQDTLEIIERM